MLVLSSATPAENNRWNTPSKITYPYKGKVYTNYLGKYWAD
jgi:hypothetical protein